MLKKIGFVTAGVAAGMAMMSGFASAEAGDLPGGGSIQNQNGLLNLNNTDVLHNVSAAVGVCDNNINVLGIQVPVQDVANGVGVPILSPGPNEAQSAHPENCASSSI
jgi:hypothetical protein